MQTESLLSQILRETHALPIKQLNFATEQAIQSQTPLLDYLVRENIICDHKVAAFCAQYFKKEMQHNFKSRLFAVDSQHQLYSLIMGYTALLVDSTHVLIADPSALKSVETIGFATGKTYRISFLPYQYFCLISNRYVATTIYRQTTTDIILMVSTLLTDAIYRLASDIHFEPRQSVFEVRARVDGILMTLTTLPISSHAAITARLKILAQCDIAEKRLPQEGRFYFRTATGISRDCRFSSCPTLYGEKIVLRLLYPHTRLLQFSELGLNQLQRKQLSNALAIPHGLILVTGPTGCGKTITLYTMLQALNNQQKNIMTIEDPVEISLDGINQVATRHDLGLDFPTALRTFLRQDPDIIMVGEIRDFETAAIAIRAAQTGHLVLSTLHTHSAAEAIIRLQNLGIATHDICNSLRLVLAQRLLRKRCTRCDNKTSACAVCHEGYSGRIGIFELLIVDNALQSIIMHNAAKNHIDNYISKHSITTLAQAAQQQLNLKITDQAEINRVLSSQEDI